VRLLHCTAKPQISHLKIVTEKALSAVLNGLLNSLIEDASLNKNGRKLETYKFMV
jgi:hypothetical protein